MEQYLLVVRNTEDVVNLMSGYQNANNIYNETGRRYYIWTNATADDRDNFENVGTLNVILGSIHLPAVETL